MTASDFRFCVEIYDENDDFIAMRYGAYPDLAFHNLSVATEQKIGRVQVYQSCLEEVFDGPPSGFRDYVRSIRPGKTEE